VSPHATHLAEAFGTNCALVKLLVSLFGLFMNNFDVFTQVTHSTKVF